MDNSLEPLFKVLGEALDLPRRIPICPWYEIIGDTGKTALIWSLCNFRKNDRLTLLVELSEPYNYKQVSQWSRYPEDQLLIINTNTDILSPVLALCKTGDIGQVIFEGLGFLIGGGKLLPEVLNRLGDISQLFELTSCGAESDIKFYTTSYKIPNISAPKGMNKTRALGSRLLDSLCSGHQIEINRIAYLTKYGLRTGERYSLKNILTSASCEIDLKYKQGPIICRDSKYYDR